MITLLSEHQYDQARTLGISSSVNPQLLSDPEVGPALEKYLLLNEHPDAFSASTIELFFNKYYWFLTFVKAHTNKYGFDAGLEQQAFQLLEEGQLIDNFDWNTAEEIHTAVNGNKQ